LALSIGVHRAMIEDDNFHNKQRKSGDAEATIDAAVGTNNFVEPWSSRVRPGS
jgi:hypothetical protein